MNVSVYPKVVFIGGPLTVSSGFPIEAFGNDRFLGETFSEFGLVTRLFCALTLACSAAI